MKLKIELMIQDLEEIKDSEKVSDEQYFIIENEILPKLNALLESLNK